MFVNVGGICSSFYDPNSKQLAVDLACAFCEVNMVGSCFVLISVFLVMTYVQKYVQNEKILFVWKIAIKRENNIYA